MSHGSPPTAPGRVLLEVPGLSARPVIGAGCCAVPAADLLREAIAGLEGVQGVTCDEERGEIELAVAPDAGVALLPIVRSILDGLGYTVRGIRS